MKILGLPVPFIKAPTAAPVSAGQLASPDNRGWMSVVRESFAGAWQRNVEINQQTVLSFHAVFACQTLIASDIAKLRVKLVAYEDASGVWTETRNPAYSPVLRKPNHFQTRLQFFESWVLSKLQTGNTYVLKERDGRGVVIRLYVLDPTRVRPLVADNGDVYYELNTDNLSGLDRQMVVPAREIIHDRFNCLFHPLVGLSPIFANGLAATQGVAIQTNSAKFFQNNSQPGGMLVAPGKISQETADRLREAWRARQTGDNLGTIAVLGDGLKYEAMATKAVDAQMVEQLKWSAEVVCSTYHVPPYKIGVGAMPSYNNVQALNVEYYSQALQKLIEDIECLLDEGLGTGDALGTEFDLDNLLRMDAATQMDVLDKGKNIMTPNEARRRLELKPVTGGDSVFRQQQDFSLEALAKRDARDDPFAKDEAPAPPAAAEQASDAEVPKALLPAAIRYELEGYLEKAAA